MIITGDCLEILPTLAAESVQCCVTSPPYYGLRDYGCDGQIGLEKTPEAYVEKLVAVFREVRRVLRDNGCLWLNLGDSYAANRTYQVHNTAGAAEHTYGNGSSVPDGLKPKDLIGIPWRVAFALQADGWWLRQDIIWSKPNPMPESVTDRCTKAHEYIFLLSKSARYFYDAEAVKEEQCQYEHERRLREGLQGLNSIYTISSDGKTGQQPQGGSGAVRNAKRRQELALLGTRNRRSVWTVSTKPFKEAHFATFPPEIPEICIKAGSKPGDTILDPFSGAGTTGNVAERLGREYIGIELNPAYAEMGERRIDAVRLPLFNQEE